MTQKDMTWLQRHERDRRWRGPVQPHGVSKLSAEQQKEVDRRLAEFHADVARRQEASHA